MKLEIFDVEHGACSLITTDDNKHVLVDCGHNATTGWRPGDYLVGREIATVEALVITNYDEDHVSGFPNLRDQIAVNWLYRNNTVSAAAIRELKSKDGMGAGIERLVDEIENVFLHSGSCDLGSVELKVFRNEYLTDFDDENNLSLVTFVKYGTHSILFPGDLQTAGWEKLLEHQSFRDELASVTVFFASHHGRDNGICQDVFNGKCEPFYVVISDRQKGFQSQETTDYRGVSKGGPFRDENRHVLTTRKDGNISFDFASEGWGPS